MRYRSVRLLLSGFPASKCDKKHQNKPLSGPETCTEPPRSDAFSSIWRIFPRRKSSTKRPQTDGFLHETGLSTRENGTRGTSIVTKIHVKLSIAAR